MKSVTEKGHLWNSRSLQWYCTPPLPCFNNNPKQDISMILLVVMTQPTRTFSEGMGAMHPFLCLILLRFSWLCSSASSPSSSFAFPCPSSFLIFHVFDFLLPPPSSFFWFSLNLIFDVLIHILPSQFVSVWQWPSPLKQQYLNLKGQHQNPTPQTHTHTEKSTKVLPPLFWSWLSLAGPVCSA